MSATVVGNGGSATIHTLSDLTRAACEPSGEGTTSSTAVNRRCCFLSVPSSRTDTSTVFSGSLGAVGRTRSPKNTRDASALNVTTGW